MGGMFGGGATTGAGGGGGINLSGIPFIGGMFPDPNADAMSAAIKASGDTYGGQRGQSAQAYQNVLSNVLSAYHPAQQALMQMYGGSAPQGPSVLQPVPGAPQGGGGISGGIGAGMAAMPKGGNVGQTIPAMTPQQSGGQGGGGLGGLGGFAMDQVMNGPTLPGGLGGHFLPGLGSLPGLPSLPGFGGSTGLNGLFNMLGGR